MRVRLSRKLLSGVALVGVIGFGLWAVSDGPPRMPGDADHSLLQPESRCLSCHGHQGKKPRPVEHPPRDDCFSCHRDPAGALHPRPDATESIPGGWRDDPRRHS